jgi:hypothetical protein
MEDVALGRKMEVEDTGIQKDWKGDIAKRIRYMWE